MGRAYPYPGLRRREIGREEPSWQHLRRAGWYRWARSHPGDARSVTFLVAHGASIREQFHLIWDRLGVPRWRQAEYDCFVGAEGGFDVMNRWFGGAVGWDPVHLGSEDVVGPGQQRPYHASKVVRALLGRDRVVSLETYQALTNPYVHARIMAMLGNSAYAGRTQSICL
jgi:hypothetical protein